MNRSLYFLATLIIPSAAIGFEAADTIPPDQRVRFINATRPGSCVWCGIGMAGVDANVPAAEKLHFNSEYGQALWGGANSYEAAAACRDRGIGAIILRGASSLDTIDAALDSGRAIGITWTPHYRSGSPAHFITALGRSRDGSTYYVCDNRRPEKIESYTRAQFVANYGNSRGWCVVLKGPKPLPWKAPPLVAWWGNLP